MRRIFETHSAAETEALAQQIGALLRPGDCIAYFGGLGAGKTTFTRGLAAGLGLPDIVCSPTFAIVQEYHGGRLSLYHFDMYRIGSEEELESTGFYDYPLESAVFAVEWAEHIPAALPHGAIRLTIERVNDESRRLILDTQEGDERFAHIGD